ncbi:hypothetical protein [Bradyrhizobium sp. Mp27]|uniref:hypothetical protein n=1 Tax=Bradyrhizobium sp. Mp27 TaxID=3042157 RepID=UPI00248BE947|nr:hypothetical protein [Bradyrhizobium sp. Mp27]MDI2072445.1 hypothetical protein [Bradyrhizobium sp. Mp27]
MTVRDESATAPGKLKAFIKSKITAVSGLFGGLSVTSFLGVLQDWKVIVALGTFILIGLALWIWMEKK